MKTVIIDYGSGNLRSAEKSFQRVARNASDIIVSARPEDVARADRIVLPGVGAFGDCHAGLMAVDGMADAINEAVITKARPFFGICVGMQLLATTGHEHGVTTKGFGWIPGEVQPIKVADPALKIPHMGWNALQFSPHPLFDGLNKGDHAYFVHSYAFRAENPDHVVARVDHGGSITAAVARDNIIGTQFHPEKSQSTGLRFIENFLAWAP